MLGAATALLFATVLLSSPAQAGLMFDLSVSGTWTGSGSIDFTTLMGTSTADVDTFRFHVATGGGSPQNYTLADINTISWSINGSDVLTLDLVSKAIAFDSAISGIVLTSASGLSTDPCAQGGGFSFGSVSCEASGGLIDLSYGGALTATAVPQVVPEPAALTLFGPMLLGIAAFLRRSKVACARG
jgi:hypothetical protein